MNKYFTYSLLQYKHSLVLGEILNIGILFYFPNEDNIQFIQGNSNRAKSIYHDFDNLTFQSYLSIIYSNIQSRLDLFIEEKDKKNIGEFINKYILANDSAGIIFSDPVIINNTSLPNDIIVKEYARLLLPGVDTNKPVKIKHNELFIIRQFNGFLSVEDKRIFEKNSEKNKRIQTDNYTVKFDFKWNNTVPHLVKSLSFDLSDNSLIEKKTAETFAYLYDLKHTLKDNQNIDFLIAKPQDKSLNSKYKSSLSYLAGIYPNTQIYEEEKGWKQYSKTTLNIIKNHFL